MASPAVFDSIFGGGFQLPSSGLLGETDSSQLRNNALLAAGLATMNGEQGLAGGLQAGLQAGQQSYQQGAGTALQLNQIKRQQMVEMKRNEIFRRNPPPQNPSMGEAHNYLSQILPQLIQVGDTEMVRSVTELLKSVQQQQKTKEPLRVDLGDRVELRDPDTRAVLETLKKGAPPRDTAAGADQREEMTAQRHFTRTNMLSDDFRAETKDIAKAANGFRTITSLAPQARAGIAAAQIGLIFAFMKALDPGSVVREAEYATAKNAAGVPDKVRNEYNKLLDGGFLTPEQVDRYVSASAQSAAGWRQQQENIARIFRQRASRLKADPEAVVIDYFEGLDALNAPAAPARPSALERAQQLRGVRP